jgi:hypothetical protein
MPLLGILAWQKLEDEHHELTAFMSTGLSLSALTVVLDMGSPNPPGPWVWVRVSMVITLPNTYEPWDPHLL